MIITLIILSALIILTKFADCYTTANQISDNSEFERNPLARFLMKRFGIQSTIWIIFAVTTIITVVSLKSVLESGSLFYEIMFIIIAAIVSVVQLFVALHNHKKNQNFLTKILYKFYNYH